MTKRKWIVTIDGVDTLELSNKHSFKDGFEIGDAINFQSSKLLDVKQARNVISILEDYPINEILPHDIEFKYMDDQGDIIQIIEVDGPRLGCNSMIFRAGSSDIHEIFMSIGFDIVYAMHRNYDDISEIYSDDYNKLRNVVDRLRSAYDYAS